MGPRRVLTFRAVARERSFSRAAERLALSQPAVSQQVGALEREVGVRLLDRRPGGLGLTPAGAALLEHADAIADRLTLAAGQLADIERGERAQFRLGAFPTALATLVPAVLERLSREAPEAVVTVEEATTDTLAASVGAGRLHLAIAFQDAARPPRAFPATVRQDLLREPFMVALPDGHRLAARRAVRLADLAGDPWTAPSTDGMIARACRDAGFTPRIVVVTREQLAMRSLVRDGLAVTLVPRLLADAFSDVALRPIDSGSPERDVFALLPAGARHPLAATALDALGDAARRRS